MPLNKNVYRDHVPKTKTNKTKRPARKKNLAQEETFTIVSSSREMERFPSSLLHPFSFRSSGRLARD